MRVFFILIAGLAGLFPLFAASAPELIRMASKPNDEFRTALIESLGEQEILRGEAFLGEGSDFIFAVESAAPPEIYVDDEKIAKMRRVKGWNLWFWAMSLETGQSHSFYYMVDGARKGGRNDVAAYMQECYPKNGVAQGTLTEKLTHTSQIYPGMETDYWIYVAAGYEPGKPAALMVWQDGHRHVDREGDRKTLNVVDNLVAEGKIPVMVLVFVSPGKVGEQNMRSVEYDTIDDTYARFLRDELLPEVVKRYNIRTDSYSRAIGGHSSGGICAFNAAWHLPDQFSRVMSLNGSYTSIQWHPGKAEGANLYPFKVRKEDVRNIRVWLQGSAGDLENENGSWPLQNIQMANSLKLKAYDFHFSYGRGPHNAAGAFAELPKAMEWLWRGYDPALTQQVYMMDPDEKKQPLYRVTISNR